MLTFLLKINSITRSFKMKCKSNKKNTLFYINDENLFVSFQIIRHLLNHCVASLFIGKNKSIMKQTKFIYAVLSALLFMPHFANAQEEIILTKKHNHHHGELLIISNDIPHDSAYVIIFEENAPERFNSPKTPSFAFMSKNQKYLMGLGGYVKGTVSMDFNGSINNAAYFTTSAIPINPAHGNDKLLQFNANQTSLFYNLVSLADDKTKFGAYINMNFAGQNNSPQIQDAYITYGGLLLGRTTSLFTDAAAIPPTIDGEGPNGLTYKTNNVLNFRSHWGAGNRFSAGLGLEMPTTDFTTSNAQSITNQYIPDFPSYIQYAWGKGNSSHVRLSSMIRNVNYRNNIKDKDDIISTYACQLSGLVSVKEKLVFYYQLAYGSGITPYIQDVSGLKLDFLPNNIVDKHNENAGKLDHVKSMSYYAGLQYNFNQRTFMSCTFSQVDVDVPDNYEDTSLYKEGYYLATNFFWYAKPNVQFGAEYLYGKRVDQNDSWGQANRLQVMMQYNF